jgi:hypothetical protein
MLYKDLSLILRIVRNTPYKYIVFLLELKTPPSPPETQSSLYTRSLKALLYYMDPRYFAGYNHLKYRLEGQPGLDSDCINEQRRICFEWRSIT